MIAQFLELKQASDFQKLVDTEAAETLTLEFKSSPALVRNPKNKEELCKDVSALANSAGGQIVYGIEEQDGKAVNVDAGSTDPNIKRDWFHQILNSNVHPRIDGLHIDEVQLTGGLGFVVNVPASVTGPHQSSDFLYYKRRGTEVKAMEDYEIKDVLKRGTRPILSLVWAAPQRKIERAVLNSTAVSFIHIELELQIHNQTSAPAIYSSLVVHFDERLEITWPGEISYGQKRKFPADEHYEGEYRTQALIKKFAPPQDFPIFRENGPHIITFRLKADQPFESETYLIAGSIATPGFTREYLGHLKIKDAIHVSIDWPE